MKQMFALVGIMTGGHFVLWWLVIGLLQISGWDYLFWFGLELSKPLIPLMDTLWPPFNWPAFVLRVALNSTIWGVCIGVLLYAVRRTFYKPVA